MFSLQKFRKKERLGSAILSGKLFKFALFPFPDNVTDENSSLWRKLIKILPKPNTPSEADVVNKF